MFVMNQSTPSYNHCKPIEKVIKDITPIHSFNEIGTGALRVNKRRRCLNKSPYFKKDKNEANREKKEHQLNKTDISLFSADFFMSDDFFLDGCNEVIAVENLQARPSILDTSADVFSTIDIEPEKENVEPLGVSKLLDQSIDLFPQDGDLSDLFRNKLLENACNVGQSDKSTGWTQIQGHFNESWNPVEKDVGPFFGLSTKVQTLISQHKGINDLYDWQKECLNLPAIQDRNNLVYALPTSGGKTLVAEILIFREILCNKQNVLFVLPFVSIVQEKVRSLSPFAENLGFLVEEYAAGKGTMPPRKRRRKQTVFVCTIEKALAIVQSLIEEKRLHEIGLVVVDELHLVGEGSGRGSTLEILITFLMQAPDKIHIVGMSATIGNLHEISKFLKAEIYTGDFRPIELTEHVKYGSNIFKVDNRSEEILCPVRTMVPQSPADPDAIGILVKEVCPSDSVLVFCPTKKNCENVAKLLCSQLPRLFLECRLMEKKLLIETLATECNGKLCPILSESLRYGVAYHHSGLTADERKILEEAFREGVLCCICCTSTLAAGVNLPAKRVILRAPYVGREFISLSKYKQMVGRAGRAGYGAIGESFLISQPSDANKIGELLRSKMDDAVSAMNSENCKDLVLSVVGLGVATTRAEIRQFFYKTLLFVQADRLKIDVAKIIDESLSNLFKLGALQIKNEDLIKPQPDDSKLDVSLPKPDNKQKQIRVGNLVELCVSRLGRAAMKGCMSLGIAQKLYLDIMRAEKSLVLRCSLHLLYLVTPYQLPDQLLVNLSVYCDVLSCEEHHAASVIGLSENHISKMIIGQMPKNVPLDVVNRFYVTLILNELWKHRSIWDVAALFQIPRGLVQSLMSSAASFSWNVLRFCEDLKELWSVKAILADFAPRLAHCCEHELLPLMDLPSIKRAMISLLLKTTDTVLIFQARARMLFNAGFKSLQAIARANAKELVKAVDLLPLKTANQIIAAAKLMLLEKAESLKEEADDVLEELGCREIPAN